MIWEPFATDGALFAVEVGLCGQRLGPGWCDRIGKGGYGIIVRECGECLDQRLRKCTTRWFACMIMVVSNDRIGVAVPVVVVVASTDAETMMLVAMINVASHTARIGRVTGIIISGSPGMILFGCAVEQAIASTAFEAIRAHHTIWHVD